MAYRKHTTDPLLPLKRCTSCGEEKPRTREYFHPRKDSRDGLISWCKTCSNAVSNARYYDPASQRKPTWHETTWEPVKPTPTKICTKCRIEKPWTPDFFYRNSEKSVGLQYKCKDCVRILIGNKPKRFPPSKDPALHRCQRCGNEYPKTTEYFYRKSTTLSGLYPWCKSCTKAYNAPIAAKNSVRYRANAKQRRFAKGLKRDRSKDSVYIARRKAKRLKLPDTLTVKEWEACLQYWGFACAVCGRQPGLFHLTIAQDHWIPLSSPHCPGHIAVNILPLCHGRGGCNNEKLTAEPEVWLTKKLGKHKAWRKLREIQQYFSLVGTNDKELSMPATAGKYGL